jgi:Amidohydrolase family
MPATAAIQALLTSGLRTIYCYTPARKVLSWDPWKSEDDYFSDQTKTTFQKLALGAPFGNGRVHMGYAIDNLYMPAEVIKPYYADLRDPAKGKAKLITSHGLGGPLTRNGPSAVQMLSKHDLLGPDILISHANFPHEGDGELYAKSGAHFSSTASTELQMGFPPVALRGDHYEHASLGVDCHSWTGASIPTQMNLILQYARCKRQEELAERGRWSRHTGLSVEQVFNLGTVGGAKAVGMEKEVGRLKEGMKADLVVFDGVSPAMLAVAEEDPVAAVVLHSSPRDIDMVLVDGVVRKEGGGLVDVEVEAAPGRSGGIMEVGKVVTWKDVTQMVVKSRRALKEKTHRIDMKQGEEYVMDLFHMNRKGMLEGQET